MELRFDPKTHTYQTITDPTQIWTSVTSLISKFKQPFDAEEIAKKCSVNRKSKWFGIPPERIIKYWDEESSRANTMGHWYHNQREVEVSMCETIRREGIDLPIFQPITEGNFKISPAQNLVSGIYPEHFVYLKSAGICGQADRVEVIGNNLDIYDYKTNKVIVLEGYTNWEGVTKKMLHPLEHLDDCNFIHYALQLSLYAFIIVKHNHSLTPRKLTLQHIIFEVEKTDDFGFPIVATDIEGNPVIKKIVPYDVPYLRKEVISLINYLRAHPEILKTNTDDKIV